jgi:hypothetical protein
MTAVPPRIENSRSVACEGRVWAVTEHPVPYNRDRRSLVFTSDNVARRVQHYPANWLELSDEALAAICAHA